MAQTEFRGPVQVPAHTHPEYASPDLSGYVTDDELADVAGSKVDATDPRLSDTRTPKPHAASHAANGSDPVTPAAIGAATANHNHSGSAITSGTVNVARLPVGATPGTVAAGDDARLTDPRTPTVHADSHAEGGSDPLTPGAIGAVAVDDTRLSDPRTPTAHAASHATGGADPISPSAIGAAPASHTHSGAAITSGTVAYPRLPVGTTAGTVAAGDHTHADTGGAGGGYVAGTVPANLGLTPAVQHSLGTQSLVAVVREVATGLVVPVAYETVDQSGAVSDDWVRFSFRDTPTPGQYSYTIISGPPAAISGTGPHTHAEADIAGLTADLAGKADAEHVHAEADVTGLVDELAAKAPLTHTHAAADVASGTLTLARIPTGSTGSTVALGNHSHAAYAPVSHTHSADAITSGTLAAARLPVTTGAVRDGGAVSGAVAVAATGGNLVNYTATGDVTLDPAAGSDRQVLRIAVLASGGARAVSVVGGVRLGSGITARTVDVPAGELAEFAVEWFGLLSVWVLTAVMVSAT